MLWQFSGVAPEAVAVTARRWTPIHAGPIHVRWLPPAKAVSHFVLFLPWNVQISPEVKIFNSIL